MTAPPRSDDSVEAARGKPIIFSAAMVKALLAGTKTQTRRLIKPPKSFVIGDDISVQIAAGSIKLKWIVGDRLWVRETWADVNTSCGPGIGYRADGDFYQPEYDGEDFGAGPSYDYKKYPGNYTMWFSDLQAGSPGRAWRSPIHMPRWASRLTLAVTDVRVQRLQEISESDAEAEGVDAISMQDAPRQATWSRQQDYSQLWNYSIHGPDAWSANPWVAALTFRVIRANIDAAPPSSTIYPGEGT